MSVYHSLKYTTKFVVMVKLSHEDLVYDDILYVCSQYFSKENICFMIDARLFDRRVLVRIHPDDVNFYKKEIHGLLFKNDDGRKTHWTIKAYPEIKRIILFNREIESFEIDYEGKSIRSATLDLLLNILGERVIISEIHKAYSQ